MALPATHDLSNIEGLCKRIIVVDKGKVLLEGHLVEMKKRLAKHNQVKFFLKDRSQAERLPLICTRGCPAIAWVSSPA